MNINFCFVRHGYSCSNAISNLVRNDVITKSDAVKLFKKKSTLIPFHSNDVIIDPELTTIGVDVSINNGCIINKILKNLSNLTELSKYDFDIINVVGCSPLIRCMETAYYMSRKWKNPPNKIYVFPLLREIDEHSDNKYSKESLKKIDYEPSYAMKDIKRQKEYLKSIGILDYFDFSFVEKFPKERKEPGDIVKFTNWFNINFIPLLKSREKLNVFITTHAGVLHDFSDERFVNNSGFVLNTTSNSTLELNHIVSLNKLLPSLFFKEYYKYDKTEYHCPSNRCGKLCTMANVTKDKKDIPIEKCDISD
jgi:hypothetical protein